MNIEAKLDQIIELLIRIEAKLSPQTEPKAPAVVPIVVSKPTKSQLKFKHMIEFAAEMDRKFFFSAIRKYAPRYMEIRKHDPNHRLSFTPQFTPKIDEKIQKTGAQFYKDLRIWSDNYSRAVEAEGEKVLQRAIGRVTARA
ncbi:MAG TPA: hypothetical protein VNW95_09405 [Mucilaginibacter sp.]|jgi:hypothetical protein|nr:hypothetical protein [Mucilaginibacter sp.]